MKTCSRCQQSKPLAEFMRQAEAKNGRGCYCKPCNAARARDWRKEPGNQAKANAASLRWRKNNPEAWRRHVRKRNIKVRFGLTVEEYDEIVSRPCQICGSTNK